MPQPMVFFVAEDQKALIESALAGTIGPSQRASALTRIARHWLDTKNGNGSLITQFEDTKHA